jgi:hypothetical protein
MITCLAECSSASKVELEMKLLCLRVAVFWHTAFLDCGPSSFPLFLGHGRQNPAAIDIMASRPPSVPRHDARTILPLFSYTLDPCAPLHLEVVDSLLFYQGLLKPSEWLFIILCTCLCEFPGYLESRISASCCNDVAPHPACSGFDHTSSLLDGRDFPPRQILVQPRPKLPSVQECEGLRCQRRRRYGKPQVH